MQARNMVTSLLPWCTFMVRDLCSCWCQAPCGPVFCRHQSEICTRVQRQEWASAVDCKQSSGWCTLLQNDGWPIYQTCSWGGCYTPCTPPLWTPEFPHFGLRTSSSRAPDLQSTEFLHSGTLSFHVYVPLWLHHHSVILSFNNKLYCFCPQTSEFQNLRTPNLIFLTLLLSSLTIRFLSINTRPECCSTSVWISCYPSRLPPRYSSCLPSFALPLVTLFLWSTSVPTSELWPPTFLIW